jgi:hypothetical protein
MYVARQLELRVADLQLADQVGRDGDILRHQVIEADRRDHRVVPQSVLAARVIDVPGIEVWREGADAARDDRDASRRPPAGTEEVIGAPRGEASLAEQGHAARLRMVDADLRPHRDITEPER